MRYSQNCRSPIERSKRSDPRKIKTELSPICDVSRTWPTLRKAVKTVKRNQAPRTDATIHRVLVSSGNARTVMMKGPPNTISQIYPTASSIVCRLPKFQAPHQTGPASAFRHRSAPYRDRRGRKRWGEKQNPVADVGHTPRRTGDTPPWRTGETVADGVNIGSDEGVADVGHITELTTGGDPVSVSSTRNHLHKHRWPKTTLWWPPWLPLKND